MTNKEIREAELELQKEMNVDYPVFRMGEIDMEARMLARAWGDEYIPGIGLEEKIKLASDFMNYARRVMERDCREYWVGFDWNKPETRPTKYGKYFVHRKDGKVHWETWNGSGWAYNGNVITHWMEVKPPSI